MKTSHPLLLRYLIIFSMRTEYHKDSISIRNLPLHTNFLREGLKIPRKGLHVDSQKPRLNINVFCRDKTQDVAERVEWNSPKYIEDMNFILFGFVQSFNIFSGGIQHKFTRLQHYHLTE